MSYFSRTRKYERKWDTRELEVLAHVSARAVVKRQRTMATTLGIAKPSTNMLTTSAASPP